MKKKILTALTMVVLAITMTACSLSSSSESSVTSKPLQKKTPYETNLGDPMFEGITQEMAEAARPASEMTKNEFLRMSYNEVRAFAMSQIPNFREYLQIDDNYTMTEEKWISAQMVLCFQYYGSMRPDESNDDLDEEYEEESFSEINFDDIVYVELTEDTLHKYGLTQDEASLLDKTPEDFESMPDEEIAKAGIIYYKIMGVTETDAGPLIINTEDHEKISFLRETFSDCYEGTTFLETLLTDLELLEHE